MAGLMILTTGCSAGPVEPRPDAPTPVQGPPPPSAAQARSLTAEDVVHHPDASLAAVSLERRGDDWEVRGLWVVNRRWSRHHAYAASTDGFVTTTYEQGRSSRLHRLVEPGPRRPRPLPDGWPAQAPGMAHLVVNRVPSLAPRVHAVVGGGDGATLLPFEAVARSSDGGATWSTHELPLFSGSRAYTSGQVVTAGGRLVSLLSHFSDDQPGRPARRHHGLWVSDGVDWTAYRPWRVRLAPDQEPSPEGWSTITTVSGSPGPDPFLWVQTWDSRVYVSTDDGRTFREVPVR